MEYNTGYYVYFYIRENYTPYYVGKGKRYFNPADKIVLNYRESIGFIHKSKTNKVCKYCGEYKNINHEHRCRNNPNRN